VARQSVGLSLFWRTFFLLAMLLVGGIIAWVQTLRALEFAPRAVQAAQQTAGLVNLTRAALGTVDGINRLALIKTIGGQATVRVLPREPGDHWEPYAFDRFSHSVSDELKSPWGAPSNALEISSGEKKPMPHRPTIPDTPRSKPMKACLRQRGSRHRSARDPTFLPVCPAALA
jgi:hypothetical protein